ncbi:MAG: type II secretion system protein [Gemmatimonadaceae bacterium]|nr:type II secretion system protein [Gemmatimonadaceae bacterium]
MIQRPGFTLIEIICVLGIMAISTWLVSATLTRHQQLYRAVSERVDVQRGVRDGVTILAEEFRGASSADTIRLLSDSAVELFTNLGNSVVCGTPTSIDVGLAPLASASSMTSWLAVPDTGDLLLIYRGESSTPATWERYRIRAVASRAVSTACPIPSAFRNGGSSSYVVTLSTPPAALTAGQPVRFIRRGRYSLYKSSDAKWYLGYRRCNAIGPSACGSIQPVSGYYQPYNADTSRTGLLLRYFDKSGQVVAGTGAVSLARVQITARALSPIAVSIDGAPKSARDSASTSVSLRNRP